jgi:hypothetical protein
MKAALEEDIMHATAEFNRLTDHQEDGEVRATFTKERLGEFCNRLAKDVEVVWSRSNAPEDLELLAEDRTTLGGLDRKHEVLTAMMYRPASVCQSPCERLSFAREHSAAAHTSKHLVQSILWTAFFTAISSSTHMHIERFELFKRHSRQFTRRHYSTNPHTHLQEL